MNKLKTMLFTLLFVLPITLSADVAVQNNTAAKPETVNELINTIHFDQTINETIDASINGLKQMLPGLAAHEAELRAFYSKTMNPEILRKDVMDIYTEMFTEQELKDLIAFYKTPTGQKALQKLPEITQRSMQLAQERVMKNQAELYSLMEKVAKEQIEKQSASPVPPEAN